MSRCGVLLLLCGIPLVYAGDTQKITLTFESKIINGVSTMMCVNNTKHILKEGYKTMIYLEKTGYVNKHTCYPSKNEREEIKVGSFSKVQGKDYKAELFEPPETNIICIFYLNKGSIIEPKYYDSTEKETYTKVSCNFETVIKYLSLKVKVNDKHLTRYLENPGEDVDAELVYYYQPNELVRATCCKPYVFGTLQFKYVQAYYYSSSAKSVDCIDIQTKLRDTDDKNYIDCIFVRGGSEVKTIVRLNFHLKIDIDKNVMKVNDLVIGNLCGPKYVYYYQSAKPKVTCNDEPALISESGAKSKGTSKAVCNFDNKNRTLRFSKYVPCNGIEIADLTDNKILFDTCLDAAERVIFYEYTDNEEINISCEGNKTEVIWKLFGVSGADGIIGTSGGSNKFSRNFTSADNAYKIICGDEKINTSIKFVYVESPFRDTTETDTETGTQGTLLETPTEGNNTSPSPAATFWKEHGIPIGGGVLAFVLLLMLVCLVIVCRRRRKLLTKTQMNYTNLEPNSHSAPPTHNEHYKNETRQMEDYAVPADVKDEGPYSVPYQQKLEDLYARPTPRNMRTDEEVKYAEIGFQNNGNYAQVMPRRTAQETESPYAEVQYVKRDEVKKQSNDEYENEFNSRYANTNQREYTEPAYCEVVRK